MEITDCFLLIDKPPGITSFEVVKQVKKRLKTKKIGHGGTLDPFAQGLLVLMLGKYTKFFNLLQQFPKVYTGTSLLGKRTDTLDITGNILEEKELSNFSFQLEEKLNQEIEKNFLGEIFQLPPMTSALKFKGKPLYTYFREGKEVNRKFRKITIYDFKVKNLRKENSDWLLDFEVKCSSGTYVRTLLADLLERFSIPSMMIKLVRQEIGSFKLKNASAWDEDFFKSVFYLEDILSVGKGIIKSEALVKALNGNQLSFNEVDLEREGEFLLFYSPQGEKIGYFQRNSSHFCVKFLLR